MKTLILAIGNTLLSDDGIGIHVLEALRAAKQFAPSDEVELIDGGTLSFTLAGLIEDAAALIVIDAAQLQTEPGTIRVFVGEAMDCFLNGQRKFSAHEISLIDLINIAQLTGHWPQYRALVAIQPEKTTWGEFPTQRVAAAIPIACQRINNLIEDWRYVPN